MKIDLKKTGALGILLSMVGGLVQFSYATMETLKEKNVKQDERLITLEEREKTSTEMLKEVRDDVKLLLRRRR